MLQFLLYFSLFIRTSELPWTNAYPNYIKEIKENKALFYTGETLTYDDKKQKNTQELLDNPDIEDQLHYPYNQGDSKENTDAGRIRNDAFFKEIYGKSATEVQENLTTVTWCPTLVNQKIQFSKINGANLALIKVSIELDQHPEWK